jgi:hypothetical protein
MERPGFADRFLKPVTALLLVSGGSYAVYSMAISSAPPLLHDILCYIFGLLFLLSLVFGVFYVYPAACRRGASALEKVSAGLACPILWVAKEAVAVGRIYSLPEGLFYTLNPVHFLLFSLVAAEMGLAEIYCRRRLRKMGQQEGSGLLPAVLALVLGLGSMVFMFAWDLGVHHFYLFQEGYKVLFGYGL